MEPLWEVVSFLHQLLGVALKSSNTEFINGFSSLIYLKSILSKYQSFSGRIQIRHWSDLRISKSK